MTVLKCGELVLKAKENLMGKNTSHCAHRYGLRSRNKWVTWGGSYPGMLAAWARLKYPHLFHAAVASSAPMTAELDFQGYVSF